MTARPGQTNLRRRVTNADAHTTGECDRTGAATLAASAHGATLRGRRMTLEFQDKPQTETADSLASSFTASYAGVVAFIAVAVEGSFARAADRLGVGRSAVSRSVQKLEAQLDARLFLRTTRSTSLTREGELFYQNCHPGVQRIVQALEDMRELRAGPPRGQLRISATMGFGRQRRQRDLPDRPGGAQQPDRPLPARQR